MPDDHDPGLAGAASVTAIALGMLRALKVAGHQAASASLRTPGGSTRFNAGPS
jgi:hypothetical protein